jgi:hypothetical protein
MESREQKAVSLEGASWKVRESSAWQALYEEGARIRFMGRD